MREIGREKLSARISSGRRCRRSDHALICIVVARPDCHVPTSRSCQSQYYRPPVECSTRASQSLLPRSRTALPRDLPLSTPSQPPLSRLPIPRVLQFRMPRRQLGLHCPSDRRTPAGVESRNPGARTDPRSARSRSAVRAPNSRAAACPHEHRLPPTGEHSRATRRLHAMPTRSHRRAPDPD